MDIYTLNVGQGAFSVVVSANEAIIIDTFVPGNPQQSVVHVVGALAAILKGKALTGLLVTGFDADHFCDVGLNVVLNKYRPNWIMYPKYFKETATAKQCFSLIDAKKIQRASIDLAMNQARTYNASEFRLEVFSPHSADMNSSNNCSLVCRITEVSTGMSYMATGDTELARWSNICRIFSGALRAHVMAAPHHGSDNGVDLAVMQAVSPHTVLVSCGIGNQYGHPGSQAAALFTRYATEWYCTAQNTSGKGQSLVTTALPTGIVTQLFSSP